MKNLQQNIGIKYVQQHVLLVCGEEEATHIVFTETDLKIGSIFGEWFSANKVYKIKPFEDTTVITSDTGEFIVDFGIFLQGEYLKGKETTDVSKKDNIIYLDDFRL